MTAKPRAVEADLGQPVRLLRGQELQVRDTGLVLRKVALSRRDPASGFEGLGDEYTLTLEVLTAEGSKRRSFSWREADEGEVRASWLVGDFEIAVDDHQVFTVTRLDEPEVEPVEAPAVPSRPPPPAGLSLPPAARLPSSEPGPAAPGAPIQSLASAEASERELVRVRKRHKKRRRSRFQKLLDRIGETLKAIFFPRQPVKSGVFGGHSHHHHGHRRRRDAGGDMDGRNLRFEQKIGWVWSLKVSKDGRTLGIMRGANPLALVGTVEDYLVAFGSPRPGCTLVLSNTATLRELPLDRELVRTLRSERAEEVLLTLDSSYPRHSPKGSGSLTVMTDERGQIVNANDVLGLAFDPAADR